MSNPGFPREGTYPKGLGRQPITRPNFPENCMKMKKKLSNLSVDPSLAIIRLNLHLCGLIESDI